MKEQQLQSRAENSRTAGEKMVIPRRKKAGHDKRRPEQQQKENNSPCELDAKVGQLTDKNEACREQLRANLSSMEETARGIKGDIERALERQVGVLEGQSGVLDKVDELRSRMSELMQPDLEIEETHGPEVDGAQRPTSPAAPGASEHQAEASPESEHGRSDAQSPRRLAIEREAAEPLTPAPPEDDNPLIPSDCFEPLTARLDPKTKFITLKASLERHFASAPELLEPICSRLLMLSRHIDALVQQNDRNQSEIAKLTLIKGKLGDLCRELQKSNTQIRVESLNLVRSEQQRAKEQTGKIQETLAGVMKLFDENQQRNLVLKQENVGLQTKLKTLLDHCGQWERCVETALKQRDIENCLLKTELKRLNLARTEEQERFLKEKQELLRLVAAMRANQGKVQDREAKLREDLASCASKYDEYQEVIQKGLGKFQVESKRMLKQIEKSRQDYVTLLNKYEVSNKKIKGLLEEKQAWVKSMSQSNKKLETLERLCRSLKLENDRLAGTRDSKPLTEAPAERPQVPVNGDFNSHELDQ